MNTVTPPTGLHAAPDRGGGGLPAPAPDHALPAARLRGAGARQPRHRARHPHSLRRRGADAPLRLRQHPRHGGAPRRLRRDDRPPARGDGRCAGAGRPADRRLRRGPRALRARRRLAPLRLPDLLRRRPRRHAADHLLGRLAARRLGAHLRRCRRPAPSRSCTPSCRRTRGRSPPAICSAPTSASLVLVALVFGLPTWYLGSYLYGLWAGRRFVLPVPSLLARRARSGGRTPAGVRHGDARPPAAARPHLPQHRARHAGDRRRRRRRRALGQPAQDDRPDAGGAAHHRARGDAARSARADRQRDREGDGRRARPGLRHHPRHRRRRHVRRRPRAPAASARRWPAASTPSACRSSSPPSSSPPRSGWRRARRRSRSPPPPACWRRRWRRRPA